LNTLTSSATAATTSNTTIGLHEIWQIWIVKVGSQVMGEKTRTGVGIAFHRTIWRENGKRDLNHAILSRGTKAIHNQLFNDDEEYSHNSQKAMMW
jgi:hypothetical protein